MGFDAFKDLAGNSVSSATAVTPPVLALSDQQFTGTSDDDAPTATYVTVEGSITTTKVDEAKTLAATSTVFELNFNEVVQKGTGKIGIYSSWGITSGVGTPYLAQEFDVTSLPLVSSVGSDSKMKSSLTVQGSSKMKI